MPMFRWSLSIAATALPAMLISAEPAAAQVFYRQWSYYGQGYPRPPAYVRAAPMSPHDIADVMTDDYRFRRVSRPQFAGHMYVVDGVDRSGALVRAYVDAFNGRLIDVDLLQAAPRTGPHQGLRAPRVARLPDASEQTRTVPLPPRRPAETRQATPEQQATRPPATAPVPRPNAAPGSSPIVPLSREPRVVNPAEVRVPDEIDRAPPMTQPTQTAPTPVTPSAPLDAPLRAAAPDALPQASAPPARSAPGASQVAPAPLDDAVRRPTTPSGPAVPPAPLL